MSGAADAPRTKEPQGGPLHGVRVIDLSRIVAGPICARILSDAGADVIKVESSTPDLTRSIGARGDGLAAYFSMLNAGKRAVAVDLRDPDGIEFIRRLVSDADVVLENFRPGVMESMGLGAESLRSEHPSLIYCSISGYGLTGPWRERGGMAPAIHAEMGLLAAHALRAQRDLGPEAQNHADYYTGLLATSAILAALFERERTGLGQHLDVSLAESTLYTMEWLPFEVNEVVDTGPFNPAITVVGILGDGTGVATAGDPVSSFPRWARAAGRADMLEGTSLEHREQRIANRAATVQALKDVLGGFPDFESCEKAARAAGLVCGRVRTVPEVASSPWAQDRQVFTTLAPEVTGVARPWRSSSEPPGPSRSAPRLGEHSIEIAEEVGLSREQIDALVSRGVLGCK